MDKKLVHDKEHDEYIVNGNRMSKVSILNTIGTNLFLNLYQVGIEIGALDPREPEIILFSPEDFEMWLRTVEENDFTLTLSYFPKIDKFGISMIERKNVNGILNEQDEIDPPTNEK